MAVYFAPSNKYSANVWTGNGGVLDTISKLLIDPMVARDTAARQYKYQNQLAADAAIRAQAATDSERQYAETMRQKYLEGAHMNTGMVPGTAEMLAYAPAIGYQANIKDMQPYALGSQQTIDLGNQIVSRQVNPNGTSDNEAAFQVGMSPKDQGALDAANQAAAFNQQIALQKLGLDKQETAARVAALGRSNRGGGGGGAAAGSWTPLGGYTTNDGTPLMINRKTGQTVPLTGVKYSGSGGTGGGNVGEMIKAINASMADISKRYAPDLKEQSRGALSPEKAAARDKELAPLIAKRNELLGIANGAAPASNANGKNYDSANQWVITPGALDYSSELAGLNSGVPATNANTGNSTGSGSGFITTEDAQKIAAKNNKPVSWVIDQAKKNKVKIVQSKY
jgi:hypothetical protein